MRYDGGALVATMLHFISRPKGSEPLTFSLAVRFLGFVLNTFLAVIGGREYGASFPS
jgi:hypothetical protein